VHTGFDGHYTNKASSTREGEATFYRTSRFRLAARQDVILRDCFKDLLHPATRDSTVADETAQHAQRSKRAKRHAQFEPMLRSSPHLQHVLHYLVNKCLWEHQAAVLPELLQREAYVS